MAAQDSNSKWLTIDKETDSQQRIAMWWSLQPNFLLLNKLYMFVSPHCHRMDWNYKQNIA